MWETMTMLSIKHISLDDDVGKKIFVGSPKRTRFGDFCVSANEGFVCRLFYILEDGERKDNKAIGRAFFPLGEEIPILGVRNPLS